MSLPAWRVLAALVFTSGASSLIYQVLWVRALSRHFGATTPAVATVLVAFMTGLAFGSAFFGRQADRSAHPLRLYSLLEAGIGVSGLLTTALLLRGDTLLNPLVRLATGPWETPLRAAAMILLLGLPTALMGATLPVLVRALSRAGAEGRTIGALYAINTAGAVAGALLPDLLLIPRIGLTATGGVAAAGNLLVALVARRMLLPTGMGEPVPAALTTSVGMPPVRTLLLAVSSGATGLAFEVLWTRVIDFWTPHRVASFSIVLATYLCAWAAGTWATRRRADASPNPLAWAGALLALAGALALIPIVFATDWRTHTDALASAPWNLKTAAQSALLAHAALTALFLEGPTCFALGAAFPFLARAAVGGRAPGAQLGGLLAANTLAGAVGSVVAGFLLLPHLGLQGGLVAVSVTAGACGLLAACTGGVDAPSGGSNSAGSRAAVWVAASSVVVVLATAVFLPADSLRRVNLMVPSDELIEVREGPTTTVAAVTRRQWGQESFDELVFPRISMSSTRFSARRYMGMLSHLGLFFAREPRNALLICYGVGNSARSLLSHPDLERLDIADISPEVLALAPRFAHGNGANPLDDPRVRVHVDDGRHHLAVSDERWSVITSEPPPPANPGVANLYSREYYALARQHLAPGGVLTQWLPVFQLDEEQTGAIIAAFVAEFPHTALFYGFSYQWVLVGSDEPLTIDLARWARMASDPSIAADLDVIGVDGMADLVGAHLQGDSGLRAAAAPWPALTDDRPSIEYPWEPLGYDPELPAGLLGDPYAVSSMFSGPVNADLLAAVRPGVERMHRLLPLLPSAARLPAEAHDLLIGSGLRSAARGAPLPRALLALIGLPDELTLPAGAARAAGSQDPEAILTEARLAYYQNDWADALRLLDALPPDVLDTEPRWLIRAGAARALHRDAEAVLNFRHVASLTTVPLVRERAVQLAEAVGDPWPIEEGPLADPKPEP